MTGRKQTRTSLPPDHADFMLDDYPLYNLNRTSATYVEAMTRALKVIGMDQPAWRVLMLLDDRNPSTVGELARRAVIKMSTITRILSRMESDGLVRRENSARDNRIVEVFITDLGRERLIDVKVLASQVFDAAFAGLSDAEVAQFVETLKAVRANLERPRFHRT